MDGLSARAGRRARRLRSPGPRHTREAQGGDRRAAADPARRRATDARPLRGELMLVEDELAEGEWLASDLVGCACRGPGLSRGSWTAVLLGARAPGRHARPVRLRCGRAGGPGGGETRERGVPRVMRSTSSRCSRTGSTGSATQRHVTERDRAGPRARLGRPPRDHAAQGGQVDDTPYGGGAGMVIRVDVVEAALEARYGEAPPSHRTIALSPAGRQFDDALAASWRRSPRSRSCRAATRGSTSG